MIRIALVCLVAACGSYSMYKTTRIAPAGHTEYLFGAQVTGATTAGPVVGGGSGGGLPLPELSLAARRGVSDDVELQLNTTLLPLRQGQTGSAELAGKVRLLHSGRWSLAAGAGAGYRLTDTGGAILETLYASAPLIGGVDLGRHQLVASVVGGYQRLYSSGALPVDVPFAGMSLGFLWQIGRTWAIEPEAGIAWSPTANFMSEHTRLFQLGIAAVWTH